MRLQPEELFAEVVHEVPEVQDGVLQLLFVQGREHRGLDLFGLGQQLPDQKDEELVEGAAL